MDQTTEPGGVAPPLSLRRAARRAGLTLDAFKEAAEPLNDTPEDLRVPGARGPVRYDPERLNAWVRTRQHPDLNDRAMSLTVAAEWTANEWSLQVPGTDLHAVGRRLVTAKREITGLLAAALFTAPESLRLKITFDPTHPGLQAWAEAEELRKLAKRLLEQASHKRTSAIQILSEEGLTGPEIGTALGLSHQRIQQLQSDAKTKHPDTSSSDEFS